MSARLSSWVHLSVFLFFGCWSANVLYTAGVLYKFEELEQSDPAKFKKDEEIPWRRRKDLGRRSEQ